MTRREFLILTGALIGALVAPSHAQENEAEPALDESSSQPNQAAEHQGLKTKDTSDQNQLAAEPRIRALIDLETQTLTLYDGQEQQRFPCVVGRLNYQGVSATKPGLYEVTYKSSSDRALHGRLGTVYGRRFIGLRNLRTGSTHIGIHGTCDGEKLDCAKRYFSLGCVRLANDVIEDRVYPAISRGDRIGIIERLTPELEASVASTYVRWGGFPESTPTTP